MRFDGCKFILSPIVLFYKNTAFRKANVSSRERKATHFIYPMRRSNVDFLEKPTVLDIIAVNEKAFINYSSYSTVCYFFCLSGVSGIIYIETVSWLRAKRVVNFFQNIVILIMTCVCP